MNRTSLKMTIFFLIGLIPLLILGCGGGGGGGGGGVGPTVYEPPQNLNGLTVPTGFKSSGFPVGGVSLSLPNFTNANKVVLAFVNTGNAATTGQVSAALGVPASVRSKNVVASVGNSGHPAPGAAFRQRLRDRERILPPFQSGGPLGKRVPGLRADTLGSQNTFKMQANNNTVINITATCRKVVGLPNGGSTYFYFDDNDTMDATATNLINTLADYWGNTIYAKDREIFGEEPPETFNGITPGKDITILLTSKVKNLAQDLAGFFYSGDLYPKANTPDSNERKIFYINYDPGGLTDVTIASTMAHEFQHMINFYQRKLKNLEEDTWLNEAMAGYAEHVCGFRVSNNNQSKALQMNMFFDQINSTSLTAWQDNNENYGQVYLFGTWFGEKFGTNGVVRTLLTSSNIGRAAVQEIAGQEFGKVLAQWNLALYVNDISGTTPYGYVDIDLRGTYSFGAGLADVTLTGPSVQKNTLSQPAFPFNSGSVSVQPGTAYFIELGGGTGASLNMDFGGGASIWEIHQ